MVVVRGATLLLDFCSKSTSPVFSQYKTPDVEAINGFFDDLSFFVNLPFFDFSDFFLFFPDFLDFFCLAAVRPALAVFVLFCLAAVKPVLMALLLPSTKLTPLPSRAEIAKAGFNSITAKTKTRTTTNVALIILLIALLKKAAFKSINPYSLLKFATILFSEKSLGDIRALLKNASLLCRFFCKIPLRIVALLIFTIIEHKRHRIRTMRPYTNRSIVIGHY